MDDSLHALGLTDMAEAIADGSITSVAATSACLDALDTTGRRFNAVVSLRRDQALEAAHLADQARAAGRSLGPLHGVPMAHKDLFYRKGEISTGGTKIRKDFVAPVTATVIERLDQAGAVDLGRLHMAEFAMSPTGYNIHHGHGLNPWSPDHCPGGSSSGSGIAVAARLIPAALGTDTGGSIRHPAAMCGIFGLKPTWGLVPTTGVMPLSHSLDVVGPMTRSPEDAALLMDVMTARGTTYRDACKGPVKGLKLAVVGGHYRAQTRPDVEAALVEAARVIAGLGVTIRDTTAPDLALAHAGAHVLMTVEAATLHRTWLETRPDDYAPQVRGRIEPGLTYSATRYVEALAMRADVTRSWLDQAMGDADLALIPALQQGVPTIAETTEGDPAAIAAAIARCTLSTRAINYLGLPSASILCGFDPSGLPIAFQLVGRPHSEGIILRLSAMYCHATAWNLKKPL
ncbi:MAG: amidase [Rhizobiales bacterium]|nr:amidase [Hyphomicrobiales bacterium]